VPHYFLLHDSHLFEGQILPAFAGSWQGKSFEPIVALARQLEPRIAAFGDKFRMGADKAMLELIARGMKFNRDIWEMALGEVLYYGARETPNAPVSFGSLRFLLGSTGNVLTSRSDWPWIDRAILGARTLRLGRGVYHPQDAGWNSTAEAAVIAAEASRVDSEGWHEAALKQFDASLDEEDRADELALARDALQGIRAIYQQAVDSNFIVVCEQIH
jgi:hypothetical protein